ncbi:hypothetical protein B0T26DRAFT_876989 [Lasiosphaeria miniovina]|uniref:Uncharacterized protein n=1 Tax=Lasiosphaeria miniovina TaxID=1954250 RepID=A0AA39ZQF5_9PEZI|nr:uncharacterized protein B0T26DRAFT_876989 [Lasiosphaeria miniovina]KAK0701668.1 hypothetical protein B0T26DRAFT_876989 [Lasiosphaeria miniovina]
MAASSPRPIRVEYVGTKSLEWEPVLPSSPSSTEPSNTAASTPAPTPDLPDSQGSGSLQLSRYARDELSDILSEYAPTDTAKLDKAKRAKLTYCVLAIFDDPASELFTFDIENMKRSLEKKGDSSAFMTYLKFVYSIYIPKIQFILDTWMNQAKNSKRKRSDTSWHTTPTVEDLPTGDTRDRAGRSNADKIAQAKVPKWYGGSCVLSGGTPVDGAHIVDVRASGMNALHFWETLDKFGGLIKGAWDHCGSGTIVDFRRGSDDKLMFPRLEHGDVYELSTADPVRCPLPSIQFLQIRYAVQKIIAGPMAAGALKDIFSGEPPEDGPGPARHEEPLAGDWEVLLEAAVEAEVLTGDAAGRWARSFQDAAYDKAEQEARLLAEFLAEEEELASSEQEAGGMGWGKYGPPPPDIDQHDLLLREDCTILPSRPATGRHGGYMPQVAPGVGGM